ncbi:MAG: hypothetical protein KF892_08455 [Rhizobacter sp.]|nr:hypothetical protein [Rhizobacter sp.]
MRLLLVFAFVAISLPVAAQSAKAGAEVGKGSSKAEACKAATDKAALFSENARVQAGGPNAKTSVGDCDCSKNDEAAYLKWECSVKWTIR